MGLLLINKAVFDPASVSTHAHAGVLQEIAARLRARTIPTTLGKVRGHVGVAGNERADACANKGAADDAPPAPDGLPPPGGGARGAGPRVCFADAAPLLERQHDPDERADPPDDGPDDLAEAATPMDTDAPAAPSNPAPPGGESEPQTFYDDIRSRVLRGLVRRRALRPAVKETALRLQRLFGPGLNRVALKPSSYFLSSAAKVTTYARTLCLKLRYNATFAGWKRHKCHQAASPNCELCGAFDHDFHTVADCTHPVINRMNIITHNEGGQKVLTAFRNQGKQGNSAVIANLGNGDAAAHEHTLPAWLGLTSRKSPDILIIKGWTQQQLDAGKFPTSAASKKKVTLLFIEYKRCSDFKFDEISSRISRRQAPFGPKKTTFLGHGLGRLSPSRL